MTNMQHYMDDIQDLLEGLEEEMAKRSARMAKWDELIAENTVIINQYERIIFDERKTPAERTEATHQLAKLRPRIRDLAEKKSNLAEKNHSTIEKVYARLNELAWHCKLEVEVDNPGCTELKERAYYRSLDPNFTGQAVLNSRTLLSNLNNGNRRKREYSNMTDEDRFSTRSGTPFTERPNRENNKKRPGRPRAGVKNAHFDRFQTSSNVSSCRSSVESENPHAGVMMSEPKPKKLSKYMRKKHEKLRLEEEERTRNMFEIKKEVDNGDYEPFSPHQWNRDDGQRVPSTMVQSSSAAADLNNDDVEDEEDLLSFLNFGTAPSPPTDMADQLSESALNSMDMYPPEHRSNSATSDSNEFRHPGTFQNYGRGAASSSQSFTQQKSNNVRLTGRVTEMVIPQREKNNNHKKHREQEDWCICNGANTNSEMMVECDNKDCRGEWFHFDCVGLTESPVDEWYCPECSQLPVHLISSRPHD
ncbi:hypothetical protein CAEBREN_09936 [Caenorhabditis brenneri]|uniref:PHD-type domain-containing protein n=1 Tax=Caenorhabditis brenneri TaxID=135651 RepID=G0N4S3_CAEBE|nr:hypothetical protein CAEBREN_09936 [Caenorhabditis brenneri]